MCHFSANGQFESNEHSGNEFAETEGRGAGKIGLVCPEDCRERVRDVIEKQEEWENDLSI